MQLIFTCVQFAILNTIYLLLASHVQCVPVKRIDLNRPPTPESSQEKSEEHIPTKKELPASFIIKKRKDLHDTSSPGYKARMIANMTGHPKTSKEYIKVYNSHYFKFRREQGPKYYEGMTKDPELSAKIHEQGQKRSVTKFYQGIQERRRTGNMTPADKRYYEKLNSRARELYKKNPEACKERGRKFRLKAKAAKTQVMPIESVSKHDGKNHANE